IRMERGEQVDDDHSRRLRTRMKFVHDVNDSDGSAGAGARKKGGDGADSGASTPANGTGTPKSGSGMLPHIAKLQEQQRSQAKAGIPVIHKPLMDDDIIGALDLDIDIEID